LLTHQGGSVIVVVCLSVC